jgi:hypothetical protein
MTKKKHPEFTIIDPKDPNPLYVARQKAGRIFVGLSPRTLGNMASLKIGPRYFKNGGICWYKIADIEEWITRHPVQTFNPEY